MRALPPTLRREIGDLSFLYRWTLPNCVLPSATTPYDDFETELRRFRSLRPDVAGYELVRPLHDHGGGRRPARRRVLADQMVRAAALQRARTIGARAAQAARLLFDDPQSFVERFAHLVEAYWEEAFAAEWRRVEPLLAEGVIAAGRQISTGGLFSFLVGLAPQLRLEPGSSAFGLDVPHDHRVELDAGNPLLLIPSVYVWPHVRVNCDPPRPLVLVYRAPHLAESLRHPSSPELVRALRALADPTRLRILRLLARKPHSTQELAPIVGLTEAGTSKHLRQLAAAGLVETRREGYYVLYSVADGQLDALGADVRRYLRSGAD